MTMIMIRTNVIMITRITMMMSIIVTINDNGNDYNNND